MGHTSSFRPIKNWAVASCRYEVQEEDGERMNLPVYFRERHSKHVGSSTSTVLFGQPLLITVPKHNLVADVLYHKILERIW